MYWRDPDEPYNDAAPFKISCRDHRGVIVTIIADNYYGYCKKEVKTQISYAANLFGLCQEEHAGGAIAFATYVLGQEFYAGRTVSLKKTTFEQAMQFLGRLGRPQTGGLCCRPPLSRDFLPPRRRGFRSAGRFRPLGKRGPRAQIDPASHLRLRPAIGLSRPPGKAASRRGLETHRFAAARHTLPQTLYRLRRRQIRNLQIHRRCPI